MNPLKFIDQIKDMYNDQDPGSTIPGPRNMQLAKAYDVPDAFHPDLEQSEFLRPGETLEDWKPNPFLKPHADGGRVPFNEAGPVKAFSHPTWDLKIPKGHITANQLAEELGIAKSTLKKYRTKGATVDKYPLKGFIEKTFKPIRGPGNYTYYLKPTEAMLENYQNFKNRTVISRDLLNDVEKLHKSKLFKDLVKSKNKSLPTLQEVVKVLGKETKAHHRAANAVSVLAKMYQGDEYKLLKLPKNEETGKFIFKALREGGKNNPYKQAYYKLAIEEIDKTLGNETGTLKNFKRYFKDNLTKYLGKGHNVTLNEVASISGMVSNDMAQYGAFVDLTNTKINNDLLAGFQGDLSKALTKIDGLKGKEKLEAIKAFNKTTLPKFKQNIADKYGNKLAEKIKFTEIVPGTKLTDTYKAKDLATWKKQGIDLQSLAKKKGYYLDVKGAIPYTEFLDNKKLTKAGKINAMETLIKSLCPKKASGGRIGYQTAGAVGGTLECGLNVIKNKNIKTEAQAKTMLKIAEAGSKSRALRGMLGVWGLGGEAIIEAGIGAYKVLGQGVPADIAWSESYWSYLDPRKYTGELSDLRKKDLEKGNPRIAKYFDALGVLEKKDYHEKWVNQTNPDDPSYEYHRNKLNQYDDVMNNFYGGPSGITKMLERVQPEVDEAEAIQAGRWAGEKEEKYGWLWSDRQKEIQADRKQKQAMKELMESKGIKTMSYTKDGKPVYEIDKELIDTDLKMFGDVMGYGWTPYGLGFGMQQRKPGIGDMKYNEDLGYRQLIEYMTDAEARDRIAEAGGVANMAGGGMVGIRKPSAIAPTGGPQSGGLPSLYNNVRKW